MIDTSLRSGFCYHGGHEVNTYLWSREWYLLQRIKLFHDWSRANTYWNETIKSDLGMNHGKLLEYHPVFSGRSIAMGGLVSETPRSFPFHVVLPKTCISTCLFRYLNMLSNKTDIFYRNFLFGNFHVNPPGNPDTVSVKKGLSSQKIQPLWPRS